MNYGDDRARDTVSKPLYKLLKMSGEHIESGSFPSLICKRVKIGRMTSVWCHVVGGVSLETKSAIILFLVMINDLHIDCPTITFVDDITTTETKRLIGTSQMEGSLVKVGDWSEK